MSSGTRCKFSPIPLTKVSVEDSFWAPRIRVNREISIPHVYQKLKESGCIDAFKLDWKPGMDKAPHVFWDSVSPSGLKPPATVWQQTRTLSLMLFSTK